MSWVTNTILHFGHLHGDDESRALEQVNEFFSRAPREPLHRGFASADDAALPQHWYPAPRGFVSLTDAALPQHWYGGSKSLECSLAIGAFNGLDIGALVEHLCTLCAANALDPRATQLILMDQEDAKFHVINIDKEMQARGMAVPGLEPGREGEGGVDSR